MNLALRITQFSKRIKKDDFKLAGFLFGSSIFVVLVQLVYLNLRYNFLLQKLPLFYTRVWGEPQLVSKETIFLIPALSIVIALLGFVFFYYMAVKFYKYGTKLITFIVLFSHVFLTYSLFRVVSISLTTNDPLISENYLALIFPFLVALAVTLLLAPLYVRLMNKWGIVTDPEAHSHPGMLLKTPSARGGGLLFAALFVLISLFTVPLTLEVIGVIVLSLVLAFFGLLDDYQNTHPKSPLSFLENPVIRLTVLFVLVSLLYFFNIRISFLSNPFDGFLHLTGFSFKLGNLVIQPLSWLFTTVWVVWILNLLSWSNGVDGQYGGIIGISLIFLALLGLRFEDITSIQLGYAQLAIIAAGISFGLVGVMWFPSKIMWGFGAMSAGVVVASLSTLIQAKVIASIMILFVPFVDASVTIVRRLYRGRNPLKGDRGHLHHLLIDQGVSIPKVALFYWIITLLFGGLSLYSAEKPVIQAVLMILGVAFFAIALVNLRLSRRKSALQEPEK
ncbi:hypothetical protein GF360_01870 [candidate division WWE3 bacterium]|nr:hypothetical protein [candidate division WWE3 bacterium]